MKPQPKQKSRFDLLYLLLLPVLLLIPFFMGKKSKKFINDASFMTRLKAFIIPHEGIREDAYKDQEGNWTIGIGHLIKGFEMGMITKTLTKFEIDMLFQQDVQKTIKALDLITVEIKESQAIVIASLVFNVGFEAFRKSKFLKRINQGDPKAGDELDDWNRITVNGVKIVSDGLTRRRAIEKRMFNL